MSFKVSVRHVGDVVILDLAGRLTLGEGSGMLRDTLKTLIADGEKSIVLNMKDVNHLDSAGLGEMVGGYASVSSAGGQIRLLNPQARLHDLLLVTKLYTVFSSYTDEPTAVQSFAASIAQGG
jgi:anti-sigma B factor antagonist